jgi:hypothetical protein
VIAPAAPADIPAGRERVNTIAGFPVALGLVSSALTRRDSLSISCFDVPNGGKRNYGQVKRE